jgi:hypothetical protein
VNVTLDVSAANDAWDYLYVVVSTANGFERHVMISCGNVDFNSIQKRFNAQRDDSQLKQYSSPAEKSMSLVSGLYFKRNTADFGDVVVGSLNRIKVDLCNATSHSVY